MRGLTLTIACLLLAGCARPLPFPSQPGGDSPAISTGVHSVRHEYSKPPQPPKSYKVLYSFKGSPDGAYAHGLAALDGNLYGTTAEGGKYNGGTFIAITPTGAERVLYSFHKGTRDGWTPNGPLIERNGTFYGTTENGGTDYGNGTVFSVTKSGVERVLYRFKGGLDGANPMSGLTEINGRLYGTTPFGGGSYNVGTVFSVSYGGQESVLFRFTPRVGEEPQGLVAMNGELYGTTLYGGVGNGGTGWGTVFEISPSGGERTLYDFNGNSYDDGAFPEGKLIAWDDDLYGTTTVGGGSDKCNLGCGTVYKIDPSGTETVLFAFQKRQEGFFPTSRLLRANSILYGTTANGGDLFCYQKSYKAGGCGTAFALSFGGETVLHRFRGEPGDGKTPIAGLTALGDALYGTTASGGANDKGTVFKIVP